ncbi:hypothetical protein Vadar_004634 [Vaccinium darrowii]|uniref:Uncharacterized protein n=1 Tax=Vaccinium darrowii TaxID=229202 RepID=A0ACB7YCU0_9ERIC|nr:hypothetical protein Vadar_004634 [Vaccinium darrowii]
MEGKIEGPENALKTRKITGPHEGPDRESCKARGKAPTMVEEMVQNTDSPFTPEVMREPLPQKFKMSHLDTFGGTTDPLDHLETYKNLMMLQAVPDEIMCRAFPVTLKGSARMWFNKLEPQSISNFKQLSQSFVSYFIAGQKYSKPSTCLFSIRQDQRETLRDYTTRFTKESMQVEAMEDQVSIAAYIAGLNSGQLLFNLTKDPPVTVAELIMRVQKHMNAEEALSARRSRDDNNDVTPSRNEKRKREQTGSSKDMRILDDLHDDPDLEWPRKLRSDPSKRPKDKWCRFHRDHGHTTDDCIDLKQQIEGLIQRGRLRRFVKNQKPPRRDERPRNNQNKDQIQNTSIGEIVVIHGGPGARGDSNKSRKAHLRKLGQMKPVKVNLVERPSKLANLGRPPIIFSEEDEEGISYPHDDPLVISMVVANYRIKRVLVDTGASTDIMYYSSFFQLGIDEKQLRQVKSNLYGFSGKPILPKGRIALPVTIGPEGNSITCMVDFLVVDSPSAYNLIIGRPLLNQIGAAISTYHLKMKFPVVEAIAEVKGVRKQLGNATTLL